MNTTTTTISIIQYEGDKILLSNDIQKVLLDTGSSISLLKKSAVPTDFRLQRAALSLSNPFGSRMCAITQKIECNLNIDGKIIPETTFYVFPDKYEISYTGVIGMDILKRFKINLNKTPDSPLLFNKFEICEDSDEAIHITDRKKDSVLFSNELKIIPAHDTVYIRIKRAQPYAKKNKLSIISTSEMEEKNIFLQSHIISKGHMLVQMKNRNEVRVFIKKGAALADEAKEISQHLLNFLIDFKSLPVQERKTHEKEFENWKRKRNILVEDIDISADIRQERSRQERTNSVR
jgi:hypothetical protein